MTPFAVIPVGAKGLLPWLLPPNMRNAISAIAAIKAIQAKGTVRLSPCDNPVSRGSVLAILPRFQTRLVVGTLKPMRRLVGSTEGGECAGEFPRRNFASHSVLTSFSPATHKSDFDECGPVSVAQAMPASLRN